MGTGGKLALAGINRGRRNEMSTDPNDRPAGPEQPNEGFAEGEDNPAEFPEDEKVGRFSEGVEELPADEPEKLHHGRFSEGVEELPEDEPEKHEERRFSEGQDSEPPGITP
jgi:hypothetical protein